MLQRRIPSLLLIIPFLLLLSSHLHPAAASPLYDCGPDPQQLTACTWTAAELHDRLTQLLDAAAFEPSAPSLLPFVQRLRDEDVDGNVFLSLERDEVAMLLHKDRAPSDDADALTQRVFQLMRTLIDGEHTTASIISPPPSPPLPPADADVVGLCSRALLSLPGLERELLQHLATEVEAIRSAQPATVPAAANYTGRWPSSPLKRSLPLFFSPTARPVIVLYGEFDVDLSFVLYHHQPDALIIQLTDRRKSDTLAQLTAKLDKRRSRTKRGKSANVVLNLPLPDALCVLRASGVDPDIIHVSPAVFPLQHACCRWWEGRAAVIGHSPGYPELHRLALTTGRRVFSDQPLWVLSKAESPVRCEDDVGDWVAPEEPLLGVWMIVKNELGGMQDTLHSILPHIDGLSVLDTGSDDGTDALIARMMTDYGVPGAVHHGPFTDFSRTRNDALRLASSTLNTTFLLMLNGDDTFIGGDQLRLFLASHVHMCGPSDEMYLVSVDYEGHKVAWSERLMRTSNHRHPDWPSARWWHYEGVTHESYTHVAYASGALGDYAMTYAGMAAGGVDDGLRFHVYHTYVRDHREKLHARAAKDVQLLLAQLDTLPDDPRTMYYLSHSYDIQDKFEEAYHWHLRRTEKIVAQYRADPAHAPVADKEECTCLLRLGKIAAFRLPEAHGWDEAEQWLELARALCTDQIEARYYLAEHYYAVDVDLDRAWGYAQEADGLRRSGEGMVHVLESETINKQLPMLVDAIRLSRRQAASRAEGTADGEDDKGNAKPKGKAKVKGQVKRKKSAKGGGKTGASNKDEL